MTLRNPWGYDALEYDGKDMRLLIAALTHGKSGVGSPGDYAPTPQGTPDATIRIAAGNIIVSATAAGELGSFMVPNDAILTSPSFDPTSSNPRWDLAGVQVVAGVPQIKIVKGTASGSPVYPSVAGLDDFELVCGVKMPASQSVINNSTGGVIEDLRTLWGDILPWLIDIDVFMTPISQTNWNSIAVNTGVIHNGYSASSGAQNDEINFDVILAAGTWTLELMHVKGSNIGIYTVTVGAVAAGTVDGYAAAPANNTRNALTGIVIPTAGKYRIKLKMATKNASNVSGSYFGAIQHIQLRRTA